MSQYIFSTQVAVSVPYVNTVSTLSAVNVQDAIDELQAEKQPLDADLTAIAALTTTGFAARTGTDTWALRTFQNTAFAVWTNPAGIAGDPFVSVDIQDAFDWGSGIDGAATIAAPTTLTRDMFYTDLTVTSTLSTAGFRVFVNGTLAGSGTIQNNGSNGSNGGNGAGTQGAGGAGGPGVSLGVGTAGGTGGNTGAGGSQATAALGMGGNGGAGGAGGGVAAVAGQTTTLRPMRFKDAHFLYGAATVQGGTGGTGGSGGATALLSVAGTGGGGGGAGGVVQLFTRQVTFNGTVRAIGGNGGVGGNATVAAGPGGGGGGGGGGVVRWFYLTISSSPTLTVTGGTGGAAGTGGAGGAAAGGVGGTGRTIQWNGTTGTYTET